MRPASRPSANVARIAADANLTTAPWLVLGPAGMLEVRRPQAWVVRCLQPGSTVCLVEDRVFARRRLRRIARRSGLVVERELVAVPTTRHPVVLVDDDERAVRHFWNNVATVPPGLARTALVAGACLRVSRMLPWSWTGAIAPGRIVIGRLP
jgi:hypothetical protein